jgi:hypothetical protein
MVGTLITAIGDAFLNVVIGFISLFVAFVVAPTINALIVAAVCFSVVGIAYLSRRLYYYLRPPTSRSPSIRDGAVGHQHANSSANNRTPALHGVALVRVKGHSAA